MLKIERNLEIFKNFTNSSAHKKPLIISESKGAVELSYKIETFDKNKKKIDEKFGKSHSWTKQFIQLLMIPMGCMKVTGITDTGNTSRDLFLYNTLLKTDAGSGDDNYGILVGTGTDAESINDYALASKITDGTGAGQLSYGATSFGSPNSDASNAWFTIERQFTNSSGGDITINEIGIASRSYDSAYRYFLIARDKLTSGEVVADGTSKTITYTIKVAAPLLKQFIDLLYRQMAYTTESSFDITSTSRSGSYGYCILQSVGPGGNNTISTTTTAYYDQIIGENIGVVIGTGTNNVTITDKSLQTKIDHGVSGIANKMYHYGSTLDEYTVSGSEAYFKISRLFHNQSGGSITINEDGIYASDAQRQYVFCVARTKLTSGVTVANDEIVKGSYTIKVTN